MGKSEIENIYAIVGDSPLPLLVLVEEFNCPTFSFFFTPEKAASAASMGQYFSRKYPKKMIIFHEIPSMNEVSEQVLAIAEKVGPLNSTKDQKNAVFVTAGTSTLALALWYHSKSNYYISLRNGFEIRIWDPKNSNDNEVQFANGEKYNLDQILESRGWSYNGIHMKKEEKKFPEFIKVSFNPDLGKLLFQSIIPADADNEIGERIVSSMSLLANEFGHSGGSYEIRGPLSRRALNLMHNSIKHITASPGASK